MRERPAFLKGFRVLVFFVRGLRRADRICSSELQPISASGGKRKGKAGACLPAPCPASCLLNTQSALRKIKKTPCADDLENMPKSGARWPQNPLVPLISLASKATCANAADTAARNPLPCAMLALCPCHSPFQCCP